MLYSEERKFIFVAVPKTGTTSIQRRLLEIDPEIHRNKVRNAAGDWVTLATHATACEIRAAMGSRSNQMTVIAFLRDPRDVLVSKYYFYRFGRAAHKHGLFQLGGRPEGTRLNLGTSLRVMSTQILPLRLWARLYPLPSSLGYISDGKGTLLVDKIGITERLHEEVLRIFVPLGYTAKDLQIETVNRTEYDRSRARDPWIKALVERRLPKDCALYEQILAERA